MENFFLRVKKNNSFCLDLPLFITVNSSKQNADSYQFPCNYHDQGGPPSLLSLEDSKVMNDTAEKKTEIPQELWEHRQGSDLTVLSVTVPIPGSLPKCSPSSNPLGHWGPV